MTAKHKLELSATFYWLKGEAVAGNGNAQVALKRLLALERLWKRARRRARYVRN